MKKLEVTCIECPMGCTMTVTEDNGVFTVEGNNCPRGEAYAKAEVTCPRRVLTTTIKLKSGKILAVKTDKPIKKENMFKLMETINSSRLDGEFSQGDIVIKNIEDDANLIATSDMI